MEVLMNFNGWLDTMESTLATVPAHLPAMFGALILVAAGWLTAKLASILGRVLSERALRRLPPGQALTSALDVSGATAVAPKLIGSFAFWLTFILFVVAAVEVLGLPILTELFSRLAAYLPNIIAAVALVAGGLIAGRLVRAPVARGAVLIRLESQADALSGVAYVLVLAISGVMALEQLGLQGDVLKMVLAVTLGSIFAAGGLAFALGARTAVANIVAARYVAQVFSVGQEIEIDGIRGSVAQLTSTAVIIQSKEGRVIVPAARFHESCPVLLKVS
jgi:small-conductance mechanosensitive channel